MKKVKQWITLTVHQRKRKLTGPSSCPKTPIINKSLAVDRVASTTSLPHFLVPAGAAKRLCRAVLCCAVPCRAVPCRAVPWCAVLCCAVRCCAVLCCAVLCCAVLCRAVPCCAVLWCAVLCCAVLCCAVICCAVPCRAVLCTAVLFNAILFCPILSAAPVPGPSVPELGHTKPLASVGNAPLLSPSPLSGVITTPTSGRSGRNPRSTGCRDIVVQLQGIAPPGWPG